MRLILPLASIDEISSITRASLMPIASATARYGSGTIGRPSWIASSTRRSSSVNDAMKSSKLEPDVYEVLLERRQIDHAESRLLLDALDLTGDFALVLIGDDEPHVEVLSGVSVSCAFVVMRDGIEAVDELRDLLEAILRHVHGRERAFAAELRRVEDRPEAAQGSGRDHPPQPLDHHVFREAEALGDVTEWPMCDWKVALQVVQQQSVDVIDLDALSPLHAAGPSSAGV